MFQLSRFFPAERIAASGYFIAFGTPDSSEPGHIVFCEESVYLERAISNPQVTAIITRADLLDAAPGSSSDKGVALAEVPRLAYWRLFSSLAASGELRPDIKTGRGRSCKIHPAATMSEKCWIGDNVEIGPNAVIGDYSVLGNGVIIGPGAVVGAEGLQAIRSDGKQMLIRHAGGVELGENVSVLANAVVSRAVFPQFTRIGSNTRVSILVNVGHQTSIGENCLIAGKVQIGGSVDIGHNVVIGPSATIKDGVKIGDHAQIKLGSVVISNVEAGAAVSGNFGLPHLRNLRNYLKAKNAPD